MALMTRPTHDPKLTRWWWRTLREWVYELIDPLWGAFRGENSDEIALANVTGINDVSAAELAALDGITATTAELNKLSGLTADTAELNKADRTAADGVAEASKNVVLDANKDILGKRFDINQSLLEACVQGARMRFEGDDYVVVPSSADLNFGNDSFSCLVFTRSDTTFASQENNEVLLIKKGPTNETPGWFLALRGGSEYNGFRTAIADGTNYVLSNLSVEDQSVATGKLTAIAIVFDRQAQEVRYYFNGEQQVVSGANISTVTGAVDSANDMCIGSSVGASGMNGGIAAVLLFNRVLSAEEIKRLTSGAPPAYADQGASQADLVTNGEDWTGAIGTTPPNSWSDSGAGTATYIIRNNTAIANFGDAAALELSASLGSKTLYQGVAQAGKRYRVSFVYRNLDGTTSSYVALGNDDNKVTLQNTGISGDGVVFEQELLADGADLKFFVDTDGTLQIDHVKVVQVGCVAEYCPDGITHAQWQDAGGNELHGSVVGAVPLNLPSNHVARYVNPGINGDTVLTDVIPSGYRIKSMVADVTGAGAGMILNVGTSAGGTDVVNGQDISANGLFDLTVAKSIFSLSSAQSLYVNDDGGTAWSGVSIDLYIETERVK